MSGYHDRRREAAKAAGFEDPLAEYIEFTSHGTAEFSYPQFVGHLKFVAGAAHEQLQEAQRLRGKERTAAFKKAAEFVARHQAQIEQISNAWSAHIEEYTARRNARAA
jgi:hypothetical protein